MTIALLDYSLNLLFLPVVWLQKISFLINLIYPLLFILLGWEIADLLGEVFSSITARTKSKLDDQLVPFGRKLVKGLIILLGLFYFVGNLGFDYTPLLAGASIGGLALALAAQETVKNVFGSVTIFVDQPFEVGDYIVFEGVDGVVEEIGLRSTRVRTLYDSIITMPNGKMADTRIDNMGVRKMRRYRTFYNLTYDTPTELIDLYVDGLRKLVLKHPTTNKEIYQIYLNNLNSHSIDILVNIFFLVDNWDDELIAREEFIRSAIDLARTIGINFAFPTQTLHIQDFPEKESLAPKYNQNKSTLIQKFNNYLGDKLDS
jgi:MscS family membrane protein